MPVDYDDYSDFSDKEIEIKTRIRSVLITTGYVSLFKPDIKALATHIRIVLDEDFVKHSPDDLDKLMSEKLGYEWELWKSLGAVEVGEVNTTRRDPWTSRVEPNRTCIRIYKGVMREQKSHLHYLVDPDD